MKKILTAGILGTALLAGTLGAGVGAATTSPHAGGLLRNFLTARIGRLMTLKSELNLTDDQKFQLRTIVMAHRTEIAAALKPIAQDRRALRDLTLAETPDDAAIRAAGTKLGTDLGDAAVLAARIKAEARKLLTPEQQQKIQDFRKQSDAAVDTLLDSFGKPL